MFSSILTGVLVLLALVFIYYGLKFLGSKSWIMGWIRGTFGFVMLGLSALIVLIALDLWSYEQLTHEQPLLTVSMKETGNQQYEVSLVYVLEGSEDTFELHGDQWQVDARIIRWMGVFRALGAKPSYRLDRIAGRYYSLEDERRNSRTVYSLSESEYGLDVWSWLNEHGGAVPGVDAVYGSATYLPMADGALFEVALSSNGLVAKPLNKVAQQAINRWQ